MIVDYDDNLIELYTATPYRKTDPETSKNKVKVTLDDRILYSMWRAGHRGSTFSHIAYDIASKEVSVSSRLSQLVKGGYAFVFHDFQAAWDGNVRTAGEIPVMKRKGLSGCEQRVFGLTRQGRRRILNKGMIDDDTRR